MDYASTTPTDRRVVRAMKPFFASAFHNPSALYTEGVLARKAVNLARKKASQILQVKPAEVIFTGSGTESDNLAIIGSAREIAQNLRKEDKNFRPHVITTNIEHVAVLESFKRLEKEGFDVTYLPVSKEGLIKDSDVEKALRPETILISVMLINNEIGTIFPIRQIGVVIDEYKKKQGRDKDSYPYLHTDASQAPNYLEINADQLNVDLLTLDGSKIYGPKGVGCLMVKSYVPIQSILYGGSHEFKLRPATENVPLIVGFATALEIAQRIRGKEAVRLASLQKYFLRLLQEKVPQAKLNGSFEKRTPNNINICLPGLNAEFAVIQLDALGVACAATTACKNLSDAGGSYVVAALNNGCEKSSLRFTLGRVTTKREITRVVGLISKIAR